MRRNVLLILTLLCASVFLFAGCDGGGDGGGGGGGGQAAAAGTKTINASGGSAVDDYAGDGGSLEIYGYSDINIMTTGSVDASFSVPTNNPNVVYTACENEFKPTSDMTIHVFEEGDDLVTYSFEEGETVSTEHMYYLMYDENAIEHNGTWMPSLWLDWGDGIADEYDYVIDCVDIPANKTVTFMPNSGGDYWADVTFGLDGDLRVAGTVMVGREYDQPNHDCNYWEFPLALGITAAAPLEEPSWVTDPECAWWNEDSSDFEVNAMNIMLTGNGMIDTSGGGEETKLGGGDAGDIILYAHQVTIDSNAALKAIGGTGLKETDGGDGGYIYIDAYKSNSGVIGDSITALADGVPWVGESGYFENNGTIDNSGGNGALDANGTYEDGWDGGDADYIDIYAEGRVINTGTIVSNGGDGYNGGYGAGGGETVYLESYEDDVYHTGSITANGGDGMYGGDGGSVELDAEYGLYSSGSITSNGGDGTWDSGYGGYIGLYSDEGGPVLISSEITANGGNITGDSDYTAGSGGELDVSVDSSSTLIAGNFDAMGGNNLSAPGYGGSGGDVYISYGNEPNPLPIYEPLPFETSLDISMDFNIGGGSGGYEGGSGGDIYIETYSDANLLPSDGTADINLYGYQGIDLSGGDSSNGDAGDGGYVELHTTDATSLGVSIPAGSITVETDFDLSGGQAGTGEDDDGGYGGYFSATMVPSFDEWEYLEGAWSTTEDLSVTTITGDLDISGGDGFYGGSGGETFLHGYNRVQLDGNIDGSGGDGIDDAGNGAFVHIFSNEEVVVNSSINTDGGDSEYAYGGDGAEVVRLIAGQQVTFAGSISASGGDGLFAGDGGWVTFNTITGTSSVTGSVDVTVGTGSDPDDLSYNGSVLVDGVDVTPDSGTL